MCRMCLNSYSKIRRGKLCRSRGVDCSTQISIILIKSFQKTLAASHKAPTWRQNPYTLFIYTHKQVNEKPNVMPLAHSIFINSALLYHNLLATDDIHALPVLPALNSAAIEVVSWRIRIYANTKVHLVDNYAVGVFTTLVLFFIKTIPT